MAIQPFAATGSPSITVPGTKQLIVETLSVQVNVTPSGTRLEAFVNYNSGGQNISLFVPLTYAYTEPSTQFDFHVAMQEVRLYPDKGTIMTVSVHAPGGNGGTLFLTVSAAPRADRPLLDRSLEAVHRLALLAGRSPSSTGAHENAGGPRRPAEMVYAV